MTSIKERIYSLYEQGLHSNVVKMCNFVLSGDKKVDYYDEIIVMSIYADSLFELCQYVDAEIYYRKCILLRKNITRSRPVKSSERCRDIPKDEDLRYKVYLCLSLTNRENEAVDVLSTIKSKHRNAKINMALGKISMNNGKDRLAIVAFKEVLEECPFAFEAAENLLKLGVKGADVNSLTVDATNEIGWLQIWLKGQAQLCSKDFWNAIDTFQQLDVPQYLRNNVDLLVTIGYCYHYLCEDRRAIEVLQRAYRLEPQMKTCLELLATVLIDADDPVHMDFLESLVPHSDQSTWGPEQWLIFASYSCNCKNYEKAGFFVHKAYLACEGKKNIEVLYVKAFCFFRLRKFEDVILLCTDALKICPYRLDVYRILVDAYLKLNRLKDAEMAALNAYKQMSNSPHAMKLQAKVLMKDPTVNGREIKKILEKAISIPHESSNNTVMILALFLQQQSQYEYCADILTKQIKMKPSSRLYQLLGDCYANLSREQDAFDCYNSALRLDPNNLRAVESLNLLVPSSKNPTIASYYTTCEGVSSHPSQNTLNIDHDDDDDDEEVEGDLDYWPPTSEAMTMD